MFKPWIGPQFGQTGNCIEGARLFVVSEGHHADGVGYEIGTIHPDFTLGVVADYQTASREPWMRTFDNIASAIAGRSKPELGREGVNAVWNAIAFYNYIPVIAATKARAEEPTESMFDRGADPFRKAVKMVAPDAIVIAGYRLWDEIIYRHADVKYHNPDAKLRVEINPAEPYAPLSDVGGVTAMKMMHPSTAFSPSLWHPKIRKLIDLSRH